ncbi:GIY-YIG nuclease family protein [Candidatus Sumerlaeota bacterium]|nr:GIY-YIG nuclease family protein [Candidatus Sumerlaeota bacterium]
MSIGSARTATRAWYVYICDRRGQLYTGITTDLEKRMKSHGARLLYTEPHEDKHQAARREREIKGWRREKKRALIEGR